MESNSSTPSHTSNNESLSSPSALTPENFIDFSTLSDEEWRSRLTPDEYAVLRQGGTERPFTGEYTDTDTEGIYTCKACGAELFRSTEKFHSHCGWPSFFDPSHSSAVITKEDHSLGMHRTEVLCATCHSHLGHVFAGEGYNTPTDLRYCINSICLQLHTDN